MDRIYMNRTPGSERIHVEIAENEVADLLDDLPTEDPEWFDATKKLHAMLVRASKDFGHTHRDTEAVATADVQPARGELWSLLDWTFWGSGMGDVFREPLADTMLAAISPEQRKQAEQLMEAWHASGRQPLGRRRYEDINAELKAAQQAQQAVMRIVDEYVIESNDVGGIDANDLVGRLAEAGFPLPEDELAVADTQPEPAMTEESPVVAHGTIDGRTLLCLRHERRPGLLPIWIDDLDEGGICTDCGADVLIPQQAGEAQ